ncbi:MAG TPA: ABC transporter substrate-binding protein [Streptosporangiaceae bacterium]|nr:ABC transporter substrate-binding protein [Streptosporangiaceae bacterium]
MWSRTHPRIIAAGAACAALALASCTSPGATSAVSQQDSSTTLNTAYYGDPSGGIDPDVFYDVEGDSMMLAMYDTLLTYRPGTTQLAPDLATSWHESADGLTYTFSLRHGVRFHDGTPFNARAVEINFKRRMVLKQAVSYMVAGIASMQTPAPYRFVVHLKKRNNAFLDYMASMYGPKIVSPQALREHAGTDHGQKWLSAHEDGTGAYRLAVYHPGSQYVLTRFDGYWGKRPYFKRVVISVIPDVSTAELQLRSGSLDLLVHGIANSELQSLQAAGLHVIKFPAAIRQVVVLNQNKAPFNSQQVRQAAAAAIMSASQKAVPAVFGSYATVARSAYPQVMSSGGELAPLPQLPAARVPAGTKITLSYTSSEPDLLQLAQYYQQALDKAGFKATLKGDTVSQEFGYISNPGAAPNATISTFNPDAAHPDTWGRPVWGAGGGVNLFDSRDRKVDQLLDAGARAPTPALERQRYAAAGEQASRDAYVMAVDDADDSAVASPSLTGFSHVPTYIWMVSFAALARR